MYTVTLIANPDDRSLQPASVESLQQAWFGGPATWLSVGEAATFEVDRLPEDQWTAWAELQGRGADLVVQPTEGRRKKVLLADMDSTMIRQECIDELAQVAGVGPQVKQITARAMNGEINFEDALIERVALMSGIGEGIIDEVLSRRITYTRGGFELVSTMKAAGAYTALVSGGFTAFTSRVAATLGFDENRANTLLVQDGKLTGEVMQPILGRDAKVQALIEISTRLGLGPADVMAVGDGANDLGMLGQAGTGVALHAKPAVAAECDIRINHGDLSALLFIQGYHRSDFVT